MVSAFVYHFGFGVFVSMQGENHGGDLQTARYASLWVLMPAHFFGLRFLTWSYFSSPNSIVFAGAERE